MENNKVDILPESDLSVWFCVSLSSGYKAENKYKVKIKQCK